LSNGLMNAWSPPLDLSTMAEIFDILGDLLPPHIGTDDLLYVNTISKVIKFFKSVRSYS
jgi:hypothetical protein